MKYLFIVSLLTIASASDISTCSESSQTEKSNVECEVPPYKYDVIVTATEVHYQS